MLARPYFAVWLAGSLRPIIVLAKISRPSLATQVLGEGRGSSCIILRATTSLLRPVTPPPHLLPPAVWVLRHVPHQGNLFFDPFVCVAQPAMPSPLPPRRRSCGVLGRSEWHSHKARREGLSLSRDGEEDYSRAKCRRASVARRSRWRTLTSAQKPQRFFVEVVSPLTSWHA